jgi:hypothetical protein
VTAAKPRPAAAPAARPARTEGTTAHAARPAAPEPRTPAPGDPAADGLLLGVLGALLREDVLGLRTRTARERHPDGDWLRLPRPDGSALLLPVRPARPGFQCDTEPRLPLLRTTAPRTPGPRTAPATGPAPAAPRHPPAPARPTNPPTGAPATDPAGTDLTTTDAVLDALARLADPRDRPGFHDFAAECRGALAARRLHDTTRPAAGELLTDRYGPDPARWTGLAASTAFDTLAARLDHPVHPAGRARTGLTEKQLRRYAPEFHPRLALRWLALPAAALTEGGPLNGGGTPDNWPRPSELGLPEHCDTTHITLPVHPLTADGPLGRALREAGLDDRAVLGPETRIHAVPTLSMRTVALDGDPRTHLKLPLATSTLGRLNRRTIKPGTLPDGAAGQRLVEAVTARETRFRDTVLHADETRWAHTGHELAAALLRRQPPGLDDTAVVPLAALTAPAPGGGLVLDRLADRYTGGDPLRLFDDMLALLLDFQTALLAHGIALESHQQNISLLLTDGTGPRLLLKDNDGPRVHRARHRAALGCEPPPFTDPRVLVDDDGPLLDLFTTVTVHLCAAAPAFALARSGHAPLGRLLGLVRDRLAEAADRLGTGPGETGALLRARVLDAPLLPVKAMVTAGTLLSKERSGARDINKHYTTGPNYLLRGNHPR